MLGVVCGRIVGGAGCVGKLEKWDVGQRGTTRCVRVDVIRDVVAVDDELSESTV